MYWHVHFCKQPKKKASAYQGLLIQQCQLQQKDFHLDQMVDQVVCNLCKRKMVSQIGKTEDD